MATPPQFNPHYSPNLTRASAAAAANDVSLPPYRFKRNGVVVPPIPDSRVPLTKIKWTDPALGSPHTSTHSNGMKHLDFSGKIFDKPLEKLADQESPKLSDKATNFLNDILRQLSIKYRHQRNRLYPVDALVKAVRFSIGNQQLDILLQKATLPEAPFPCYDILKEILKLFKNESLTPDEKCNFLYFSCNLLHKAEIYETIISYEVIESLLPYLEEVDPSTMVNFNKRMEENHKVFFAAKLIKWVLDSSKKEILPIAITECAYGYPWFLDTTLFITFICLAIRKPEQSEENKKNLLNLLIEVIGVCQPELRYSCSKNYLKKTIEDALKSYDSEIQEAASRVNDAVVPRRSNSSGSSFSGSLLAVSFESPFTSSDSSHYSSFSQPRGSSLSTHGSGDISEAVDEKLQAQASKSPLSFEEKIKQWNFRSDVEEIKPFAQDLFRTAFRLIRDIPQAEFYGMKWEDESDAIQIYAALNFFHHLETLVASRILRQERVEDSAKVMGFFLKLARKCLEINDFFCSHAIITGIEQEAILRLEKTFKNLSTDARDDYVFLKAFFNSLNDYPLLRERLALPHAEWENPFTIPKISVVLPLGIHLSDLKKAVQQGPLIQRGEMNYNALSEIAKLSWRMCWSQRVPPSIAMPETDISRCIWDSPPDSDKFALLSRRLEASHKKN